MQMNRFDDATVILEIGNKRCPNSKELQAQLDYTKQLVQNIESLECLKINGMHSDLIKVTDRLGEDMMGEKHILLARASAFLALDQSDKAVEVATKIHEIDSSNMEALVILAKANYLEGNIETALVECQKALNLGDQSQGVNMLYGMINDVAQAIILADQALQNQNYKEACSLCTKTIHIAEPLLKSSPLYRKLYLARSEANLYAGNYMQAVANANLVLGSLPESIDAWSIKIKSLESLDRHQQLIDELEKVVAEEWGSKQPSLLEAYNRAKDALNQQQEEEEEDDDNQVEEENKVEEENDEEKDNKDAAPASQDVSTNNSDNDEEDEEEKTEDAPNYYEFLGVTEDTSIDEIQEVARAKAREITLSGDSSPAERAEAEEKLRFLQECLVFFFKKA